MRIALSKGKRIGELIAIDIFAVSLSIWAVYMLEPFLIAVSFLDVAFSCLIYILIVYAFKGYTSLWEKAGIDEFMQLALGILGSSVLIQLFFFLKSGKFNLEAFMINTVLMLLVSCGFRIAYRAGRHFKHRMLSSFLARRYGYINVLLVGAGDTGRMVLKDMAEGNTRHYHPVGIIDDNPMKQGMHLNGVRIIGGRDQIEKSVSSLRVEEIIVAIPSASSKDQGEILKICTKTGKKVRIIPSIIDALTDESIIGEIRDVSLTDLLGREPIRINDEGLSGMLTGATVLITGGAGSIGSEVVRQCMKFKPKRIVVYDIAENNMYMLALEIGRMGLPVELITPIGSIRDEKRLDAVFRRYKPDIVFHAAAHKHVPLMQDNPSEAVKNNVYGTMNTAKVSVKHGVKSFIFISSDKAVNPTSVMGASKRLSEMMLSILPDKGTTKIATVRFGNVLGSEGSVVPIFQKQIEMGGPVTVTHPDITRYFMLIPEAAQLVLEAASMAKGGELFMLDMGTPVKIADMAKQLIRLNRLEPDKDIKIEYTGLRPGEKMFEELFYDIKQVNKTSHEKVFVIEELAHMPNDLMGSYEELLALAIEEKDEEVAERLKKIVGYQDSPDGCLWRPAASAARDISGLECSAEANAGGDNG